MDVLGRKGYGTTMTNCRDRFPKGLKPFLHHDKVLGGCQKAKAFRYEMPIVAVKQQTAMLDGSTKAYTRTLVSFQSTGATNICGVNNLPSVTNYVSKKARGRGKTKHVWGIEQNEARETYLRHYYGVDNLDHMIKNTSNWYITWKYWHAPYLHAKSMGIIAAYDHTDFQDKRVSNTRSAETQELHLQSTRANVGRQTAPQVVTYGDTAQVVT
jgi:hypothetical protein